MKARRVGDPGAPRRGYIAIAALALFSTMATAATDQPSVFSPGVISGPAHDSAPAFTPDGRSVYFGRSTNEASFILRSDARGGSWSAPRIAPFSGRWLDMEPAMAPDGSYLVFVSNRPATPESPPLDGALNGTVQPGRGANLWRVDRSAHGWSEPYRLPDVVNATTSTYAPSIAASGNLYFMRVDGPKSRFRLFMARGSAEGYATPEPVPFSNGDFTDVDPAVAADESFIVFGSSRHPGTDIDLFVSLRHGDRWDDPVYLGDRVNSAGSDAKPRLSPDQRTLYFSSERTIPASQPMTGDAGRQALADMAWNNGLYNIWMVDLDVALRAVHLR